jgi:hypothetical protein
VGLLKKGPTSSPCSRSSRYRYRYRYRNRSFSIPIAIPIATTRTLFRFFNTPTVARVPVCEVSPPVPGGSRQAMDMGRDGSPSRPLRPFRRNGPSLVFREAVAHVRSRPFRPSTPQWTLQFSPGGLTAISRSDLPATPTSRLRAFPRARRSRKPRSMSREAERSIGLQATCTRVTYHTIRHVTGVQVD